jgi:hypothetical protein
MKHVRHSIHILGAMVLTTILGTASVRAQTCSVTPSDPFPYDQAIQDCLDLGGLVSLEPGTYVLRYGLRLKHSGTILTSSNPPARVRFVAHPDISEYGATYERPLLRTADPAPNFWEISHVAFDGNKFNRVQIESCYHPNDETANVGGTNVIAKGFGFVIKYTEIVNAMCGSGLEVYGDGFQIYDNTIHGNGFSEGAGPYGAWADGMTVGRCGGGVVWNNYLADNSDVDLIIGDGQNCTVRFNQVYHNVNYAFAGIQVGGENAYLAGSQISDNYVQSGYNLLSFGFVVGAHPWNGSHHTLHVGNIEFNQINGAVINGIVEGVYEGRVWDNSAWNPQGTRGYGGCPVVSNYTVGHVFGGAQLQPGGLPLTFDNGVCQ